MRYLRHRLGRLAMISFVVVAGCSRGHAETGEEFRPDPIPIHVRNENFLDMNVSVVVNSVSRRLGTVTGNSAADFKIAWSVANGQPMTIIATPIGGRGIASSGALSVGVGQMIEFKIGSTLRQSVGTVREP